MLSRIRWFLIIGGVLVLAIFSLANTENVPLTMPLVFNTELPLAMLLAVSFLIGFMVGSLWTAWMLRRPAAHKASGKGASGKGASGKGSGTKAPPATAPSSTEPADRPPDPHLP